MQIEHSKEPGTPSVRIGYKSLNVHQIARYGNGLAQALNVSLPAPLAFAIGQNFRYLGQAQWEIAQIGQALLHKHVPMKDAEGNPLIERTPDGGAFPKFALAETLEAYKTDLAKLSTESQFEIRIQPVDATLLQQIQGSFPPMLLVELEPMLIFNDPPAKPHPDDSANHQQPDVEDPQGLVEAERPVRVGEPQQHGDGQPLLHDADHEPSDS
jgi:hypothetical protein